MTAAARQLVEHTTSAHLRAVGEAPATADIVAFRRDWWDGAAHVPCLVVDVPVGPNGGRCRLVEICGHVVALPASTWRARRAIRRLRRPAVTDPGLLASARNELDPRLDGRPRLTLVGPPADQPVGVPTLPVQRRSEAVPVIRIEQRADGVRCTQYDCAALVPIAPPGEFIAGAGGCPRCGR